MHLTIFVFVIVCLYIAKLQLNLVDLLVKINNEHVLLRVWQIRKTTSMI